MIQNLFHYSIPLLIILNGCGYTNLVKTNSLKPTRDALPPEPFEVIYSAGLNELNSVEEYVKKDLVKDGFAQVDYRLTNEDKIKIYDAVKNIDWSTYPDRIGTNIGWITKSLWIKYGNIEKRISWSTISNPKNDQEFSIREIEEVLNDVLYNSSAYRSLPPANCGRL
ncbi:MAG: hypothetical protein Q8M94_00940 [Ignavibacteria bacterium]|nr:hypothetical protein [Ignavibacteria bacterium]